MVLPLYTCSEGWSALSIKCDQKAVRWSHGFNIHRGWENTALTPFSNSSPSPRPGELCCLHHCFGARFASRQFCNCSLHFFGHMYLQSTVSIFILNIWFYIEGYFFGIRCVSFFLGGIKFLFRFCFCFCFCLCFCCLCCFLLFSCCFASPFLVVVLAVAVVALVVAL